MVSREPDRIRGIIPAITSPCDKRDRFLEETFAALAAHLYSLGAHGLYVCGGTGDGYNMRLDERKRAVEIAVNVSRGFNGIVIAHVGTSNSRDSMELADHAGRSGVDAVASMPPANRNQTQLMAFYRDVADVARVPMFIYHIPALTHQNPTLDDFLRLLDIPGVAGLKFSDANLFFMKRIIIARPDAVVFNGNDELLCPGLMYGAHGGIGATYNLFPRLFVELFNAIGAGDPERAMFLQNRFLPFLDLMINYGVFVVIDLIMREKGFGPYSFRRPRIVMDKAMGLRFHREADRLLAAIDGVTEGSLT